jgi:diguanylate cyclase (GGDEF)-like protein
MNAVYLSVRWKIILLASLVLGLTSALFIWQQHRDQLREFTDNQAGFRERSHFILDYLFQSQAERMQMLANLLVAQPNVREDILNRRGDRLAERVEALATELSFDQGVAAVVFHDAAQQRLGYWGNPDYASGLLPFVQLSAKEETPQTHVECKVMCIQLTVIPINDQGHTIATVSIISNLESILSDLHRLSTSDVAVLKGSLNDESQPLANMQVISVSGGAPIREVLDAARQGIWPEGRFQLSHAGLVHQVVLIPTPLTGDEQVHFVVIPNVTKQIGQIDSNYYNNLMRGLAVMWLAMLLLYLMLRLTMRRIQHVSQILPLLGQEKFTQVRENYAVRPRAQWLGGRWSDEVDELESLAMALAGRLEQLKNESVDHADSLNLQASELMHERDLISGLLDTAPVLILSYDETGRIQLANAYALSVSAKTVLVGESYPVLFQGVSQEEYIDTLHEMQVGVVCRTESCVTAPNGTVTDVLWFHSRLADAAGHASTYLSVGMDITEHRINEAKIHNLAFYDVLTKLPNRRGLCDYIQHAMASSARHRNYCALAFIDLDHFKSFNDSRGQDVGDQLLVEIAGRLRASVREFDTVAHLGGDEFVVLLEELSEDAGFAGMQMRLIGEKLRVSINQPCLLQGASAPVTGSVTASVGVCLFSGHEANVDELLRHANIAMSHAKTAGRNTLRFFDPMMQSGIEARTALHTDLHQALSGNQFSLFYQVQTDEQGHSLGAEALLRWTHPVRGMVSPLNFIPFAEESELILPIGLWVLQTACAQIKVWESDPLACHLQLAVNVSARQFHQENFVELVLKTLDETGANPGKLKLELTESMVLNDIADSIRKMQELKKIGVSIAIDDFGTAYSSLSYLTQLPLDQLKIDQSFVRNIGVKPSDAIIVKTIINMASNLEMDVIAEGVETEAQREFLQGAGCLVYQGYLFSKPLALEDFSAYLATGRV